MAARSILARVARGYNEFRPQRFLKGKTPRGFAETMAGLYQPMIYIRGKVSSQYHSPHLAGAACQRARASLCLRSDTVEAKESKGHLAPHLYAAEYLPRPLRDVQCPCAGCTAEREPSPVELLLPLALVNLVLLRIRTNWKIEPV